MGSDSSPAHFSADVVPQAPEDPLFGLITAYRKDTSDKKVDLGVGAYRDNNAKPWILPVVKKVSVTIPGLCKTMAVKLTNITRQTTYYATIQT